MRVRATKAIGPVGRGHGLRRGTGQRAEM